MAFFQKCQILAIKVSEMPCTGFLIKQWFPPLINDSRKFLAYLLGLEALLVSHVDVIPY
jgi:hypothetical protein